MAMGNGGVGVALGVTEFQLFLRIRGFLLNDMRYINSRFTYLLTYCPFSLWSESKMGRFGCHPGKFLKFNT